MYPFERFSELAKKVLLHAQEEAERAGHSYIGTEHLLLGLLREPDGLAAKALWGLGVHLETVRATIEEVVGESAHLTIVQVIPTANVKRAIELAFTEAQAMRSDSVSTEHLLLGLMIEGTSVAPRVLTDMGADLPTVRAEIERLRAGGVVERAAQEVHRIFEVGSRVLVHDREPPHRLWEGRIATLQAAAFAVSIPDHPGGKDFMVEPYRMHPIPLLASPRCALCQAS